MRIALLLASLTVLAAPLPPRATSVTFAQPAAAPKPPDKPGAVRGRVAAADTGRPLRRARVSIAPDAAQSRALVTTSTNQHGAFELRDVPPGRYILTAARSGYVEVQYGQRRPRERGLAIEVKSGQTTDRIDIAMARGSVLGGRIVDELGEPYPGVSVFATELRYVQGRRARFPAGTGITDDTGGYRISGLPPGHYNIAAASSEQWRHDKREIFGYAMTFYPGRSADLAQNIPLALSQDRLDLDFTMISSRTVRISGRVLRANGEPANGENVMLARSMGTGIIADGIRNVRTAADGTFEFAGVPPADYMVTGRSGAEGASVALSLTGADVPNLVLVLRAAATMLGQLVTDEGGPPPFSPSDVRVHLVTLSTDTLPTMRVVPFAPDWSIRLTSLAGPLLFRLVGLPDDWMLDSVRLGERDITDVSYDVPLDGPEISGLVFSVTKDVGVLTGTVRTADGKPSADATVVVFSEDASHWTPGSRHLRSTRPTPDGAFTITGLPAGTYLAVARDVVLDGQWENREFLESVRVEGARVALSPGRRETVALTVK